MRNGKERDQTGVDFPYFGIGAERVVEDEVAGFVEPEPDRGAGKKTGDIMHGNVLRVRARRGAAEHAYR